jgi:hypothetical protein
VVVKASLQYVCWFVRCDARRGVMAVSRVTFRLEGRRCASAPLLSLTVSHPMQKVCLAPLVRWIEISERCGARRAPWGVPSLPGLSLVALPNLRPAAYCYQEQ